MRTRFDVLQSAIAAIVVMLSGIWSCSSSSTDDGGQAGTGGQAGVGGQIATGGQSGNGGGAGSPAFDQQTTPAEWAQIKANAKFQVFGGFGPVQDPGPPINTTGWEDSLAISADGQTLAFTYLYWDLLASDVTFDPQSFQLVGNFIRSGPNRGYDNPYPHVLLTTRAANGAWQEPKVVDFGGHETWADGSQFSFDTQRLYVSIGSQDSVGKTADLWYSNRAGDGWGPLISLGEPPNSIYVDENPSVSMAEDELFFSSKTRPGAVGGAGADIWMSTKSGNSWLPAVNVGADVNSPATEVQPFLTWDGAWMYFTSSRDGSLGIYRAPRDSQGKFGKAEPVVMPDTASGVFGLAAPSLTADNSTLYFIAAYVSQYGEYDCDVVYVETP